MRRYKYIGETDELTTNGKIYNVKKDGTFIDDTNTECCLGNTKMKIDINGDLVFSTSLEQMARSINKFIKNGI